MYVRGRDIEEAEHAVTFDNVGCRWTILGDATDVHRSRERGSILAVLSEAPEPMGPSDIAAVAKMPVNNAKQLLHKMAGTGEVEKVGRGQYVHPDRKPRTPGNFDNSVTNDQNRRQLNELEERLSGYRSYRPPDRSDGCEVVSNVRGPHKLDRDQANSGGRGPRCDHCGEPATASNPVQLCAIGDEEHLLHPDCQADWLSKN